MSTKDELTDKDWALADELDTELGDVISVCRSAAYADDERLSSVAEEIESVLDGYRERVQQLADAKMAVTRSHPGADS